MDERVEPCNPPGRPR